MKTHTIFREYSKTFWSDCITPKHLRMFSYFLLGGVFMDAALKTLTNIKSTAHKYSRMHFRYEPIGTTLYLYNFGNDKFYLSKKRKKPNAASFMTKLQVRKLNVGNKDPIGYINTYNLLLGDFYSVQSDDNGYLIFPANKYEKEKKKEIPHNKPLGYVGTGNRISLAEYNNFLFSKQNIEVTVDIRTKFCLSMKPVDHSTYPTRKQLVKKYGTEYFKKLQTFTFVLPPSMIKNKAFQLPSAFLRMMGTHKGDVLPVYQKNGEIIIEGKMEYCTNCGERINYGDQSVLYANACNECHEILKRGLK